MATVAPFNAFEDTIDDLFRGFFARPVAGEHPAGAARFRVDVTEDEKAYRLRAELAGVKKDDIQVTLDGETVAIAAEVKNGRNAAEGQRVLRAERHYGKLYRAFTLEQPVDEAGASARFVDGVLELTLPKKAAVQARRITIQ